MTDPYGSALQSNLTRNDSPINLLQTKVTFKGTLKIPQALQTGAHTISVAAVNNNFSAGHKYGIGVNTPSKLRDLIGADNALLVRQSGELNLFYGTRGGATHNTTLSFSCNNPAQYNKIIILLEGGKGL